MKRKSTQQATAAIDHHDAELEFSVKLKKTKNLRSKLPRRRRAHISPILLTSFKSINAATTTKLLPNPPSLLSLNSNCDDVSCNTTLESAVLPSNAPFQAGSDALKKPLKTAAVEVSVSENSCVESCSVVAAAEAESKLCSKPRLYDAVLAEFSTVTNSPSATTTTTVEQNVAGNSNLVFEIFGSDLTCSESFSYDEYENSSALEIRSGFFAGDESSEYEDFTDEITPSIWLNSGSQFSEKSFDDSSVSPCFSLFKEFYQQISKLSSDHYEVSSLLNYEYSDDLARWRFEDEEDEESYRLLRSRERNQASKATDYVEEYEFATEYGGLIVEQRLLMVNWIIDRSHGKELQNETMFLGVSLLDRFLSKGFFTSRRNLQLLGIACLNLAIRIEENQPYNSVRQKVFHVGSNVYGRTEVVAMEWVVQEVLKFQCYCPTIYNFLWFYLKAASATEEMKRKANYLASLALVDHAQLRFWPSTVAASLVILVSLSAKQDESYQRIVEAHVRTKIDDLSECIKSLEWLVKHAL